MRLLIFTCLSFVLQAIGLAHPSNNLLHTSEPHLPAGNVGKNVVETPEVKILALTLVVDSIHNVDCVRATGYLALKANGGVQPYTYAWSNGNTGAVSTNLAVGPYTITVTDNSGNTASVSANIVEDITGPEAGAGDDMNVACSNTIVTLNGTGSTGANYQYLWTASNGGQIQSGANTLTPVIKHAGDFLLKVTNTTNGCFKTSSVVVTANNEPPVVTATGGTFTCLQPSVILNSTYPVPNTKYVWTGPNNYTSNLLHPQVSVVGTFIFKVTDTLTTCINTANAVVVADTAKPVAVPLGGLINCAQPTLTISGTYSPANATFNWSGPNGFTSILQNPVASVAGDYKVTVTNPINGCTTTKTATVTSNFAAPSAFATVNGTLSCAVNFVQLNGAGSPAGITFAWTGPGGFTSSSQNTSASVAGVYTLTTKNPVNGCTATSTATAQSNTTPPGVTASGGIKTCSSPNVTLQATSPTQSVSYKWSGPGGFTSTLQNPSASIVGTYTVTVTNPVNGCISTASVGITQNIAPPNVSATSAVVSCNVPNPHVVATSTTSGATFAWTGPNGFTSNIFNPTVSVGGSYTVTATSPVNGCTAAKTIFVDENLATPFTYAGEDRALNCNFASILTNPIGTTMGSNITYLWTTWDGHIYLGETTLYARIDAPGHYTLTTKNTTSGCTSKDSMEVTQTQGFLLNTVQLSAVSCNGGNNGSVKTTPDGGAFPYTYIWSNGSTTATVNNLSAAAYNVTATDSEGCTAVSTVSVTQPSAVVASISATPQTMVGVNNGTASVNPSGGTAPYSLHWSNGGTSPTIMNLAPGAYTVTVTDSKGCTKTNTANVNGINCAMLGETTATNLTCAGAATGTATANVSGAVGPFTYNWSNGATTKTASNLAAGNYAVTVSAPNGCSTVLTTQITGPQPLMLSTVSNTSVTCSGLLNGAATFNATGGVSPYNYAWSNGSTGATITGVGAGAYTCTTTDANGCTSTQTTQVTSPQPVVLAVLTKVDVPCNDGQTGSITMSATGGTSPFSFAWSNNNSGATISNLAVGNYQCTVTDAHGCTKNQSAQIVATDNTPPQLILKNASVALNASGNATVTPAMFDNGSFDQSCNIVNFTINPSTFNCSQIGTNTVTLTATDKNGNTATSTALATVIDNIAPTLSCPSSQTASPCASTVFFNAPQVQDNCTSNNVAVLTSGLPSGSSFPIGVTQEIYSYTDAGGNTATCQFSVTVSGSASVESSVTPTSCSGNCDGTATLSVLSGPNPASVNWSNGQSGLTAVSLCPGSYFATVTDVSGCSQVYSVQIQTVDTQAPIITCPNNVVAGYCNPVVSYTQPQVLDNCAVNFQQLQMISGLPSGTSFPIGLTTQLFRYTDGGGNVAECSFTVTVHLAASINSSATNITCSGDCNGGAIIAISGGQGPFGVLWNNGFAGPAIGNLCPGVYTATVTDADGCQQMQIVQIMEPNPLILSNSNVINDASNSGTGSITVAINGGTMPYTYAWTRNGQPFSATQNLFGLFSGQYVLLVTDARGCTFSTPAFTISTSSVATSTPEDQYQWLLYPNPAQAEVFLKLEEVAGMETHVSIFDASGRLVLDQDATKLNNDLLRIDLSNIPDGMLLVRITNEKGSFSKMLLKLKG